MSGPVTGPPKCSRGLRRRRDLLFRGRGASACQSFGQFTMTPSAPRLACSTTRMTVWTKCGSSWCGAATRKWPCSEFMFKSFLMMEKGPCAPARKKPNTLHSLERWHTATKTAIAGCLLLMRNPRLRSARFRALLSGSPGRNSRLWIAAAPRNTSVECGTPGGAAANALEKRGKRGPIGLPLPFRDRIRRW